MKKPTDVHMTGRVPRNTVAWQGQAANMQKYTLFHAFLKVVLFVAVGFPSELRHRCTRKPLMVIIIIRNHHVIANTYNTDKSYP